MPSSAGPRTQGPKTGAAVASFYTRAVTGPLRNKSLCYVCRNGERPVVMVLLRRIDPELQPLLKTVDRLIDKHRADGLRGFGVYFHDDSVKATSAVQTFAFDNKIAMPLTIAGETVANGTLKVDRKAAITVVLYRKRRVVRSWTFQSGELKAGVVKQLQKRIAVFAVAK